MDSNKEKTKQVLSGFWQKASDVAKNTVSEVQKNAANLSEKTQKAIHEQKIKKYRPLTAKEFKSKSFNIPNVIEIVDDAVRRDIVECEGAIGWREDHKGVEVLHLYDEFVKKSGIQFIPSIQCDAVYCVDNFDRSHFINANYVFSKTNEEKLAELANIAHSLGAKKCSIEILEEDIEKTTKSAGIQVNIGKKCGSESNEQSISLNRSASSSGKRVLNFDGSNTPRRPELKWFAHDENIKGLIEMRCGDRNSIRSTSIELRGSSCVTMSRKVACAIDSVMKVAGGVSIESQSVKEYSSKLIFDIEF